MPAEPDGQQIPPRGAIRHVKFLRDDGGVAHPLVVEHLVGGPAFRFPAGPVRQQDHPPQRFGSRHIILCPGGVVVFRLAQDLVHADALIRSDLFVVFTHDNVRIFLSFSFLWMGYMCKRIRCLGILSYKCTIVRAVNGSWRILSSWLMEGGWN